MTKDIMTSGIEMSDVIKSTGFPVPSDLEGKTFAECISSGSGGEVSGDSGISYVLYIGTDADEYVEYRAYIFTDYINNHNPTQINELNTVLKGTYKIVGAKSTDDDNNYKNLLNAIVSSPDTSGIIFNEAENTITFEENWSITGQTADNVYNYGFNFFLQQGEGGTITVEALTATENKVYIAPEGKAYSPVNVNVPSSGSWHNIEDSSIEELYTIIDDRNSIVAFRMTIPSGVVKGAIMGGDGDGGITVSACGMKVVDYWDRPSDCFFNTEFYIEYNFLSWAEAADAILEAYNSSTNESVTFTSFEIYY